MDRFDKLLAGLTKEAKILEVGPSYSPAAPGSAGWNSYVLDHATQSELQQKYRAHNVPIDRIETVDFVWHSGPPDAAIPSHHRGTFDACIASHVIEHSPDMVEFLAACRRILRPGGRLCLAIPDKRYCFDYFKPISTTADVLDSHLRGRQRHSKKTAFSTVAYNVLLRGTGAWSQHPLQGGLGFETSRSLFHALAAYRDHPESESEPYRDLHAWYFTPSSFELLLLELSVLGFVSFVSERIYPTMGCEFIAVLAGMEPPPVDEQTLDSRRLQLLYRTLFELRQQIDYLAAAVPGAVAEPPSPPASAAL